MAPGSVSSPQVLYSLPNSMSCVFPCPPNLIFGPINRQAIWPIGGIPNDSKKWSLRTSSVSVSSVVEAVRH